MDEYIWRVWKGNHDTQRLTEKQPPFVDLRPRFGYTFLSIHGRILSYACDKRYDASFTWFENAITLSGKWHVILGDNACFLATSGNQAKAQTILVELDSLAQFQENPKQFRGLLRVALGEEEAGFALLKESVDDRDGFLVYLRTDPFTEEIREHPRFREIIRKIWSEE